MTSLSLITVPVLIDTSTDASQLLHQWSRMYHYGHLIMPSVAVSTMLLHAATSVQLYAIGKPWVIFACSGLTSIAIAPFTWTVMEGTNNKLFRLLEQAEDKKAGAMNILEVKRLVKRWSWLHLARSMLPLVGTLLGVAGVLAEL